VALGLAQLAQDTRAQLVARLDKERGEVWITAGIFKSGPDGRDVKLPGFYIEAREVTNAAWSKAMQKGGLAAPAAWPEGRMPQGKDELPVTGISFPEAESFAKAVGKRLPTSLEWEKAGRGTDGRLFPWGDRFESGRANVLDGGAGVLEPVSARPKDASPFGVLGLAGNALEWVRGEQGALVAGGGFRSNALTARLFERAKVDPATRHPAIGFRCARDAERE
jgi:formylglycine-generating enzyme required for sulfatase activity